MWVLKYMFINLALFGIAIGVSVWGKDLGLGMWLSPIVACAAIGYLVVFLFYRREVVKREREKREALSKRK